MTGATVFATDAYHAASKRSVKIIAGIRYVWAKLLGDQTLGSGRCGEKQAHTNHQQAMGLLRAIVLDCGAEY